jgi:hypothetical protein
MSGGVPPQHLLLPEGLQARANKPRIIKCSKKLAGQRHVKFPYSCYANSTSLCAVASSIAILSSGYADMTTLLPPPADRETVIYIQRYIRRRWRLSVAWATLIAAFVSGVAMLLARNNQASFEESIHRLEVTVASQRIVVERAQAADNTREELTHLRRAVESVEQRLTEIGVTLPVRDGHEPLVPEKKGANIGETQTSLQGSSVREEQGNDSTVQKTSTKDSAVRENDGFRFALSGCMRSGGTVTCSFTLTNRAEVEREMLVRPDSWTPATRAIDDIGTVYRASDTQVGRGTKAWSMMSVPSLVDVPVTVWFNGVSLHAKRFAVLQLYCSAGMLEWRDISIST